MKEVTKEQFKEIYFKLGGGEATGWGLEYWNEFFEEEKIPGMKYLLEEPETPEHTRMMIVTDYETNEYRLFFFTEKSEESFFDFPDEGRNTERQNKSLQPIYTAHPDELPGPTGRLSAEPPKQRATHVPFFPCGQGVWLFWSPILSFVLLGVVVDRYAEILQSQSVIPWIVAAPFMLSAIVAFGLTYHTNHSQPRKEFEIRTGREWFRRPTHSLFWLRSQYWGLGYLVIAVVCFFLVPAGR